ncbi:MAG: radical SAM protein [Chloroflexi bacterium]|nr:radical SAM protein [Chloroflexota bacterium]
MNYARVRSLTNLISDRLQALPLMVVYLTDGCNSRCAMCDIWKSPRCNMDLALVAELVAAGRQLNTQMVLLSGGEAMQHPRWPEIAQQFRDAGIKVWLLTNGLLLKKQAPEVLATCDLVTVSLDAATSELYAKIRGVDALDLILTGIQEVCALGVPIHTRTTVMRANFRQIPLIVDTALAAGADSTSFLPVDSSNPFAFGPRFAQDSAIPLANQTEPDPYGPLLESDLPDFWDIIEALMHTHRDHFADGRIAESPDKIRQLYAYFAAPYGHATFQPPRCNAPHVSMVVNVDGTLQPCFFLPATGKLQGQALKQAINSPETIGMRQAYRQGERHECDRCVCPLYRGPRGLLRGF